jgi:hypothetical protein
MNIEHQSNSINVTEVELSTNDRDFEPNSTQSLGKYSHQRKRPN